MEKQGLGSRINSCESQRSDSLRSRRRLLHFFFLGLLIFVIVSFCYALSITSEPAIQTKGAYTTTSEPAIQTKDAYTTTSEPAIQTKDVYTTTSEPAIQTKDAYTTTSEPAIQTKDAYTTTSQLTNQYHVAYARNYHFIMDEPEACHTQTPFLVLMVPVAPSNLEARDAIRQTWGNETLVHGKLVQTLFLLGLPGGVDAQQLQEKVQQESEQHHDLLQSNFMDTYINLTIKTMVIMDWLATHCTNASYAMKIDSDMFLNIDNLVTMLVRPDIPKVNYLTGMIMWDRPVIRDPNSKWYVPETLFPDATYPTYTLGMGYVFSNDLPEKFIEISKDIKPFNIEDAYIGMCMKKLGHSPTGPPNPAQFKAYLQQYNRCEFSTVITYILSTSAQLVEFWTDLKKSGPPC